MPDYYNTHYAEYLINPVGFLSEFVKRLRPGAHLISGSLVHMPHDHLAPVLISILKILKNGADAKRSTCRVFHRLLKPLHKHMCIPASPLPEKSAEQA